MITLYTHDEKLCSSAIIYYSPKGWDRCLIYLGMFLVLTIPENDRRGKWSGDLGPPDERKHTGGRGEVDLDVRLLHGGQLTWMRRWRGLEMKGMKPLAGVGNMLGSSLWLTFHLVSVLERFGLWSGLSAVERRLIPSCSLPATHRALVGRRFTFIRLWSGIFIQTTVCSAIMFTWI